MVSDSPTSRSTRRISDLTARRPADRTLENLLRALTTKLDLCARLSVFEYEAESDGYPATADAFRSLAATEREAFRELLLHLRRHLDDPSLLNLEAPGVASDIDSSPGSKDRSER